ncbi:hypothetical protein VP01_623g4 [Puccinia sorghi]|uniref:Sld7 C-terminal domain-containing protein n=1 Tax=Puccinia sorghi TaxID=27349 RepID=A0A0L6UHB9_9BASI|nr:hypothetical protein VP01_623g4 [Puccinia sorghi]
MVNSSQKYIHSDNSSSINQPTNDRLLWRGSFINQAGSRLHGLAIVAHAINPKESLKVRHDPFSAMSGLRTLSDTCLELEMLRGRDLQVERVSQLTLESQSRQNDMNPGLQRGSRKSRVASLLKGKDPESSESSRGIPFSEIECDPQVRLYVDPRCSQTHAWIISQLAKRELNSSGVTSDALIVALDHTVDVGSPSTDRTPQELIIFGRRVDGPSSQASSSKTPVPLLLVIGQRKPSSSQRVPRPDDPMPRAIPALLFGDPIKSRTEIPLGTVLSKSKSQTISAAHQTTSSALGEARLRKDSLKATKMPVNTPGRRAKRYVSSDDNGDEQDLPLSTKSAPTAKRKLHSRTSNTPKKVKVSSKTPGDGGERLREVGSHTEEAAVRGDEEQADGDNTFETRRSPSPSPASFRCKTTTHIPTPETLKSPFESMKQLGRSSLAFMDVTNQRVTSNPEIKVPSQDPPKSRKFAASKGPPETEQAPHAKSDFLTRNKLLIRKLTSESLGNRGLHKQHPKFKDLYGAVCRGVQFAMREAIDTKEIDKNLTKSFVESHLAMYLIISSDSS